MADGSQPSYFGVNETAGWRPAFYIDQSALKDLVVDGIGTESDPYKIITYYDVTASAGTGGTAAASPNGSVIAGTSVTFTATANNGYTFDKWNDGDKTNPRTEIITGNTSYTALFKPNPTIVVTGASNLKYNKNAQSLISSASHNSDGAVSYGFSTAENTKPTEWKTNYADVKATNAGTYYIWYKADEGTNYAATAETRIASAVTIAKADPDLPSGLTAKYGQTLANITLPADWAWKNPSSSVGDVGVKQFEAMYTPTDTVNYNTVTKNLSVTVNKANVSVTAPEGKSNLKYTGSAQELIKTAGSATGGILKYSLNNKDWVTNISDIKGTDAKTYTIYYKVDGDNNYSGITAQSITVIIDKVTPTVIAPEGKSNLKYTGSAQELIKTAGSATGGTLKYSLNNKDWVTNISDIKGTDAKTYTIYYKVDGDNNYSGITAQSITVIIYKGDPDKPQNITAIHGQRLGDVLLPNGWSWIEPDTIVPVELGDYDYLAEYKDGNDGYNQNYTSGVTANVKVRITNREWWISATGHEDFGYNCPNTKEAVKPLAGDIVYVSNTLKQGSNNVEKDKELTDQQKAAMKNYSNLQYYDLTISDEKFKDNDSVTVMMPFDMTGKNPANYDVYYIADDGSPYPMNAVWNQERNEFEFQAYTFSTYLIDVRNIADTVYVEFVKDTTNSTDNLKQWDIYVVAKPGTDINSETNKVTQKYINCMSNVNLTFTKEGSADTINYEVTANTSEGMSLIDKGNNRYHFQHENSKYTDENQTVNDTSGSNIRLEVKIGTVKFTGKGHIYFTVDGTGQNTLDVDSIPSIDTQNYVKKELLVGEKAGGKDGTTDGIKAALNTAFGNTTDYRGIIEDIIEMDKSHEITIKDETNGTVEGLGIYSEGETVTLMASPAEGYVFKNWTDMDNNVVSTNNPYIFAMGDTDMKLQANFVKVVTDITLTSAVQTQIYSEYIPKAVVTPEDAVNTNISWTLINAPEGTFIENEKVTVGENTGFITLRATIEGGKGNVDFKKDFNIEVKGKNPIVYYYRLDTDGKWKMTEKLTDTATESEYTPKAIENYIFAGYSVNEYKDEQNRTKTEDAAILVQGGTEALYLYYVPESYEDGILFTNNNEQLAISSSKEGTYCVIFAAYKGNALVKCKIINEMNVKNGIQIINVPSNFNADDVDTIKAFLWKDVGEQIPICDEAVYKK